MALPQIFCATSGKLPNIPTHRVLAVKNKEANLSLLSKSTLCQVFNYSRLGPCWEKRRPSKLHTPSSCIDYGDLDNAVQCRSRFICSIFCTCSRRSSSAACSSPLWFKWEPSNQLSCRQSQHRHKRNDGRGLQAREPAQYLALLLHHFATPPEDLNSKCQALYRDCILKILQWRPQFGLGPEMPS